MEVDEAENIVGVLASEEFQIGDDRPGCAYVSRASFPAGDMRPGTFWLDGQGRRHFFVAAEAGELAALLKPVSLNRE